MASNLIRIKTRNLNVHALPYLLELVYLVIYHRSFFSHFSGPTTVLVSSTLPNESLNTVRVPSIIWFIYFHKILLYQAISVLKFYKSLVYDFIWLSDWVSVTESQSDSQFGPKANLILFWTFFENFKYFSPFKSSLKHCPTQH